MFDLGMSELLVIGVVALIVIGPKDLPELFRSLGRFTAKMRSMAREFSRAMEAAADEAGVKDVASDLKTMTSAKSMGLDAVKDAAAKFEKWDPLKPAARPAPTPAAVTAPVTAPVTAMGPGVTPAAATPAATPAPATTLAPAAPALGPATQALADAQAERRAKLLAKPADAAPVKAAATDAAPAARVRGGRVKPAAVPVASPGVAPVATTKPAKPKAAPKTPKTPKADA